MSDNENKTKGVAAIAAEHLGKGGSYKTRKGIDSSLLVAIPRELSRDESGIKDTEFEGFDVWNAYEFSVLKKNGFPVAARLKIIYPVASEAIVESKSLKLYLHSFNFEELGTTRKEALEAAVVIITEALTLLLEVTVSVAYFTLTDKEAKGAIQEREYLNLDSYIEDKEPSRIGDTVDDRSLLKDAGTEGQLVQYFTTENLRSNCRVTHQPDWATVYIGIDAEKDVDPESLLRFIVSLRGSDHFHEEATELIFDALNGAFNPRHLEVVCLYTRRGGIDINPVRLKTYEGADGGFFVASSNLLNYEQLTIKGFRQ